MGRKKGSRGIAGRGPFRHRHVEQLLSNYRHLTPGEQARVQEHFSTCADCRRQLETFKEMDRLLEQDKWLSPHRRLRQGFYAAIDAGRGKRQSFWAGKWTAISGGAGQAASLVLLVLLIATIWVSIRQESMEPGGLQGEGLTQPASAPTASPHPNSKALLLNATLGEAGSADFLALSKHGFFLAAAQGSQVQIWSTSSGRLLETIDIGPDPAVDMAFTPNAINLIVRTSAGRLQRWRVAGGARLADSETPPLVAPDRPFATSNDHLALATPNNQVELWEMTTGDYKQSVATLDALPSHLSFSGVGDLLLVGDSSGTVHVWDLNTGIETSLTGPPQPIVALAINQDGNQIAAGFAGGGVRIWTQNDAGETILQTLPHRMSELLDMHFANDGITFFRLFQDGTLEHWSIGEAQPDSVLTAPPLHSGEFALLSNSLILARVAPDGSVGLWKTPE